MCLIFIHCRRCGYLKSGRLIRGRRKPRNTIVFQSNWLNPITSMTLKKEEGGWVQVMWIHAQTFACSFFFHFFSFPCHLPSVRIRCCFLILITTSMRYIFLLLLTSQLKEANDVGGSGGVILVFPPPSINFHSVVAAPEQVACCFFFCVSDPVELRRKRPHLCSFPLPLFSSPFDAPLH